MLRERPCRELMPRRLAVGFGYFETMIRVFTKEQYADEIARVAGLTEMIAGVGGFSMMLFEDMVEETIKLLRLMAEHADNPVRAHTLLMDSFNNREISSAIIYHLRLLAASTLKASPELYAGFIPGNANITLYSQEALERPDREIEHLGLTLLTTVLLKPVGFFLDVVYLDRSPGSQVNVYHFPDGDEPDPETLICLLYRPDHYDVLYRHAAPQPVDIQVHRAAFAHRTDIESTPALQSFALDLSPLALIPGFAPSGMSLLPVGAPEPISDAFAAPPSPWLPQSFPDPVPSTPVPAAPPSQLPQTPLTPRTPTTPVTYPLRFSREMHRLPAETFAETPFTTPLFKNSHYNKAHFANPQFHPEEWTPEDDGPDRPPGRRRGRHKGDHHARNPDRLIKKQA